ncbi:MAG: agmatinase [Thermodesulfovibrionia bacterium]|nr:agmatinase [Thermodesulfovibrionia bacterium]
MKSKLPHNFGCLPKKFSNYKNSSIVILPVSFDKTSTWLKGSDKGPRAIIEASKNLELYDIETRSEVYKKGIFTEKEIVSNSVQDMINKTYRRVKRVLHDKKFAVVLGGEHTVSIGSIKAYAEFFKHMSILHLDAHSDMRDSYEGSRYSHACVMSRIKEVTENFVSVGIRSMDSSELKNINEDSIFYASHIYASKDWIHEVTKKLSENVYITLDLDVFDPSVMPSTGTPEPGGLDWYQVVHLLEDVSKYKNIVGFDIVELCPSLSKAPDFLAAKLIYKLLSLSFI